jgi:salicylate hydroxylase
VDLDPLSTWVHGRVALLGDAAHPMLPFLAQGAAQAIEDAAMLGQMLVPDRAFEAELAAYSAARRPRANRVQRESRQQARVYHIAGPQTLLRDFFLQSMGGEQLLRRFDWLYRGRGAPAGASLSNEP